MQRRSFLIMAAMATGLVLGVVFGPTLRGSIASAQTEPPATQPQSRLDSLRNLFLDKLAAALNIQRPALDSAITSAGTSTLDEAVQQGTLTQEQADAIKPRLEAGGLGALFDRHGLGRPGRGGLRFPGVGDAMLNAAATALNLTPDEVKTQLRSGQTLAELAQAQGTTEEAVKNAALAAAKTQLDAAVADGTLTQAQADALYARLEQGGLFFGIHGGGRHGRGRPVGPPSIDPAPADPGL